VKLPAIPLAAVALAFLLAEAGCQQADRTGSGGLTPESFNRLVAAPGDATPLNPKLAALPLWTNAVVHLVLTYVDGRKVVEDIPQTAKTVQGRYVVFSTESKLYKSTMYSVLTYDTQASAFKIWALFGNVITEGLSVVNFDKHIVATTSYYVGGFTELSVGSFSERESSERTFIYKDGKLFGTRDVTIKPDEATN